MTRFRFVRPTLLVAGGLLMSYPLLWMISSSFKPDQDIFSRPGLFPSKAVLEHYVEGWNAAGISFLHLLVNSLIVAGGVALGTVLSCSIAAYAFARLRFPLRRSLFAIMLVTIMLPGHVTLVPKYILFNNLGWIDSYLPLIVPAFLATDGFFVFLLVQFIRVIPTALDDAARVDGCNPAQVFWYVILPLLRPALTTTAVFSFIWTYSDFFSQLIYISDPGKFTVSLGLQLFLDNSGGGQYGNLLAMSTLSLIPILLLFVVFQRQLIAGFATSGLR